MNSQRKENSLKTRKPPIYDRSSLYLTKEEVNIKIKSGIKHWRLKLDEEPIEWNDMIHGKITFTLSVSDQ